MQAPRPTNQPANQPSKEAAKQPTNQPGPSTPLLHAPGVLPHHEAALGVRHHGQVAAVRGAQRGDAVRGAVGVEGVLFGGAARGIAVPGEDGGAGGGRSFHWAGVGGASADQHAPVNGAPKLHKKRWAIHQAIPAIPSQAREPALSPSLPSPAQGTQPNVLLCRPTPTPGRRMESCLTGWVPGCRPSRAGALPRTGTWPGPRRGRTTHQSVSRPCHAA